MNADEALKAVEYLEKQGVNLLPNNNVLTLDETIQADANFDISISALRTFITEAAAFRKAVEDKINELTELRQKEFMTIHVRQYEGLPECYDRISVLSFAINVLNNLLGGAKVEIPLTPIELKINEIIDALNAQKEKK